MSKQDEKAGHLSEKSPDLQKLKAIHSKPAIDKVMLTANEKRSAEAQEAQLHQMHRTAHVDEDEWAARITKLKESLSLTQVQFAKHLGVSQSTVSGWEGGDQKYKPSAEMFVRIGNLAPYPESLWFWRQAGMDVSKMEAAGQKQLEKRSEPAAPTEIVRVPLLQIGSASPKAAGEKQIAIPASYATGAATTICVSLSEGLSGPALQKGDTVVIDTSDGDFRSLIGTTVAIHFIPEEGKPWQRDKLKDVVAKRDPNWRLAERIMRDPELLKQADQHPAGPFSQERVLVGTLQLDSPLDYGWQSARLEILKDEGAKSIYLGTRKGERLSSVMDLPWKTVLFSFEGSSSFRILGRVTGWLRPAKRS